MPTLNLSVHKFCFQALTSSSFSACSSAPTIIITFSGMASEEVVVSSGTPTQLTHHHYSNRCEVFCTQVECGAENSEVLTDWVWGS